MQSKLDDISKIIKEQIRNYSKETKQDEIFTNGYGHYASRALDHAALGYTDVAAEQNRADVGLLEVERHTESAVCKLEKLF